jgi:peptide/nickel transport system permease protein
MWAYVLRRLLYSIPVYLGIILVVMLALRVSDPVNAYLGKNASPESIAAKREAMGLNTSFAHQYVGFVRRVVTLNFGTDDPKASAEERYESWKYAGQSVGKKLREAILPSLSLTVPALILSTIISITIGMISAYFRGTWLDRTLMFLVVLGMSVSVLVFIVIGQKFGGYWIKENWNIDWFAASGYETWLSLNPFRFSVSTWAYYCLLPVLIYVLVAIGYDTRFYRAVMVEETGKDYITTARAKGAGKPAIMFVHMLKNAMIPIITRIMTTLPFLIVGSILLEYQFRIPGMGKLIIDAIRDKDFPIIQTFTAVFAAIFILSNILTDVLYALVDPRVRLS